MACEPIKSGVGLNRSIRGGRHYCHDEFKLSVKSLQPSQRFAERTSQSIGSTFYKVYGYSLLDPATDRKAYVYRAANTPAWIHTPTTKAFRFSYTDPKARFGDRDSWSKNIGV
jgi:hypothetical protein